MEGKAKSVENDEGELSEKLKSIEKKLGDINKSINKTKD